MNKRIESEHLQDCIAGLFFAVLGAASVYWSTQYTGASGLYPRVLGLVLLTLGLFLTVRSILRSKQGFKGRRLVDSPRNFFITLAIAVVFLLLVPVMGFYSSSLLVLMVLPVALGFRRAAPLLISGILFTVVVYVLFSLVLERPLPREFFQI